MARENQVLVWADIQPNQTGIHGLELEIVSVVESGTQLGHGQLDGKIIGWQIYEGRDREGAVRRIKWNGTNSGGIGSPLRRLVVGEYVRIGEAHSKNSRHLAVGFGMPSRPGAKAGLEIIEPWGDAPPADPPVDPPSDDPPVDPPVSDENLEQRVEKLERRLDAIGLILLAE